MPSRIETTFEPTESTPDDAKADLPRPSPPTNRMELSVCLEALGIQTTTPIIPALFAQLKELSDRPLDGVLLNLLPAQPESAMSSALCHLAGDEVLAGFQAVARAVGDARTVPCAVALDRHDRPSVKRWRQTAKAWRSQRALTTLRVYPLLNRYPQADPTLLLWALFGKRLRVQASPTLAGWLMVDAVTCWALGRYLRSGQPFTRRPVQIFVEAREPRLVMGRMGEPLTDLCRRFGIDIDAARMQAIVNGMLTGQELPPAEVRVECATESIALREAPLREDVSPCISCGWCVDICPTGLTPVALRELAKQAADGIPAGRPAREARHCIACGLCSYVCPTRLPLMENILDLRLALAAGRKEAKHAS